MSMGRVARPLLLLVLLVLSALALIGPGSARGDEAIARRLVALRSLTTPGLAPPVRPVVARPRGTEACPPRPWWSHSDYALESRTRSAVRDAALLYSLDPALLRSVIRHESAGNPEAVSHKGALGLMQLMPGTARELGVVCPFDPRENVLGGARYLRRLNDRLGTWPRTVAAYHAGPDRVERGSVPAETRRYVARVMGSWRPAASLSLAEPQLRP